MANQCAHNDSIFLPPTTLYSNNPVAPGALRVLLKSNDGSTRHSFDASQQAATIYRCKLVTYLTIEAWDQVPVFISLENFVRRVIQLLNCKPNQTRCDL